MSQMRKVLLNMTPTSYTCKYRGFIQNFHYIYMSISRKDKEAYKKRVLEEAKKYYPKE